MKIIIAILTFTAVMASIPAVLGINHARYSSSEGWFVIKSTLGDRLSMGTLCVICIATAMACWKRIHFGWWIISVAMAALGGAGIISGIVKLTEMKLVPATVDIAIAGMLLWSLIRYWLPKRSEFAPRSRVVEGKQKNSS